MKFRSQLARFLESQARLLAICWSRNKGDVFSIHAHDCDDLARERRMGASIEQLPHPMTPEEAAKWGADDINAGGDFDPPWKPSDFKIYQCCYGVKAPPKPLDPKYCPGSNQPWQGARSLKIFSPCPVCHRLVGNKGARVPLHAKTAEVSLPDGRKIRVGAKTTHVVAEPHTVSGGTHWTYREYESPDKAAKAAERLRKDLQITRDQYLAARGDTADMNMYRPDLVAVIPVVEE